MLEIISSGETTKLHSFPELKTKCTYSHVENQTEDFQVFKGNKNLFLSVNKKSGFELVRSYHKNGIPSIDRMKKRIIDNISCGAASSIENGEIALGTNSGDIKFFNILTADYLPVEFKPDKIGNSVIYLNYSNCNEVLASIYGNGDVCFYGLKTSIKMYTFQFDKNSTLLKFNPIKRFSLAIASYAGAINVFDTQSKRILFQDKGAHLAPCSDVFWSPSSAETILTCGFDCKLNIYDTRKRAMVTQLKHDRPFSTIAISSCGKYCTAGTLNGELFAYDLRQLKSALASQRVHEGIVARVAFLHDNSVVDSVSAINVSENVTVNEDSPLPVASKNTDNDSFNSFLECCSVARKESIVPKNRDSFFDLDFAPGKYVDRTIDASMESRLSLQNNITHRKNATKSSIRLSLHVAGNELVEEEPEIDNEDEEMFYGNNVLKEPNKMLKSSTPVLEPTKELSAANKENIVIKQEKYIATPTFANKTNKKVIDLTENTPQCIETQKESSVQPCNDACSERFNQIQEDFQSFQKQTNEQFEKLHVTMREFFNNSNLQILFNMWGLEHNINERFENMGGLLADYVETKQLNEQLKQAVHQLLQEKGLIE